MQELYKEPPSNIRCALKYIRWTFLAPSGQKRKGASHHTRRVTLFLARAAHSLVKAKVLPPSSKSSGKFEVILQDLEMLHFGPYEYEWRRADDRIEKINNRLSVVFAPLAITD
ncbi:hypothetical protein RB195_011778 [Necator americanus]|uniref:Uncharacterized protein n=1 Tax=Necator americanus TaxID=51031 RepID=A0ABR1D5A6_NECAM